MNKNGMIHLPFINHLPNYKAGDGSTHKCVSCNCPKVTEEVTLKQKKTHLLAVIQIKVVLLV